jgi:hypothetical protein
LYELLDHDHQRLPREITIMKIIDPGHVYDLDWLDGDPDTRGLGPRIDMAENRLIFVKREGDGYPGNVGHHPGTNMQEVLRALIDRVKYLDRQIPHPRNETVISNLRHSLWCLEQRAAERHGRTWDPTWWEIELQPTCPKCGHIGCRGGCKGHEPTT